MANISRDEFAGAQHDHFVDLTTIITPPKGATHGSLQRFEPFPSSQTSSESIPIASKKRSRSAKYATESTAKRTKVDVVDLLSSGDEGDTEDMHEKAALYSAQRRIPAKERRQLAQLKYLRHEQPRQPLKTMSPLGHNIVAQPQENAVPEHHHYKPLRSGSDQNDGQTFHPSNNREPYASHKIPAYNHPEPLGRKPTFASGPTSASMPYSAHNTPPQFKSLRPKPETHAFTAGQLPHTAPQVSVATPTGSIPSTHMGSHLSNASATPHPVGLVSEGTSPLECLPAPGAPAIVPITEPTLCPEQRELKDLIVSGANVFYTGSAGCGKSTVLKAFVSELKSKGKQVDIIAPTGRAALSINGSTTWTYAGWTPDSHKKPLDKLRAAAHGKYIRKKLRATDVLVIDEISMVENLHFERLNAIMKEARESGNAFGGVQMVVTGDFCQLPPVKPFQHCIECGKELKANISEQTYKCFVHGEYKDIDKWAFRSQAWDECGFVHVNLTQIHRQSDKVFIDMLQKCRMGVPLGHQDKQLLLDHPCEVENAVRLFSTKEEVKRVNQLNFSRLTSRKYVFPCLDDFKWNSDKHRHLEWKSKRGYDGSLLALQDHRFDTRIELKEGMLVVLLVNLSLGEGLVNGSQGVITGFEPYDPAKLPKAPEKTGRQVKEILPNGLVIGGDYSHIKDAMLKNFIESPNVSDKVWPIVTFDNGVVRTIFADCTINELGDEQPYSLLSRTQIPLTAAWAMSIHKSQGMTLNRVTVDLSKSFEEGQMYVALSRARSLEGLKVEGMRSTTGRGNEQVKEFLWEKFKIKC